MIWQLALTAVAVALGTPAQADVSLEELARHAMSAGRPNRVPGPIAELLDLSADAPVHQLKVQKEQTNDDRNHLLEVLVELSTGTPRRPIGPIGLVLSTRQVTAGASESRLFRANLHGTLERAARIQGRDGVKGSGTATKQDIESSEVKEAFQHELDLWLKRHHLKREWRSAEFAGGALKKKGKAR